MESFENEIEPGHRIGQPRVSFTERTLTQYRNLLASLNLLETQSMNRQRLLDRQCVQVVVPPAALSPVAAQVRPEPGLVEVVFLPVDPQQIVGRHRDGQPAPLGSGEPVARTWDGTGQGSARRVAQGRTDEPQLVQPRPRAFEPVADVDHVHGHDDHRQSASLEQPHAQGGSLDPTNLADSYPSQCQGVRSGLVE
jgi:hypothetical protein